MASVTRSEKAIREEIVVKYVYNATKTINTDSPFLHISLNVFNSPIDARVDSFFVVIAKHIGGGHRGCASSFA